MKRDEAAKKMTILITGDNMMRPEMFRDRIEEAFGRDRFEIRIKKYDFEETGFSIAEEDRIPSGMCFESPAVKQAYPSCGVSEFYGDPFSLQGCLQGVDLLIIMCANLFAYALTVTGVCTAASNFLLNFVGTSKFLFLLIVNILFLIAGMLVDGNSAYYIFVPILLPCAINKL